MRHPRRRRESSGIYSHHTSEPGLWRLAAMAALPDPLFPEGYVHRWWELKSGELEDLMLAAADMRTAGRGSRAWTQMTNGAFRLRFLARQLAAMMGARRNVSRHYDIGDDLYFSFLDPVNLQYSCAFWRDGDDLAAAQKNKIETTFRRLDIPPEGRVLDIVQWLGRGGSGIDSQHRAPGAGAGGHLDGPQYLPRWLYPFSGGDAGGGGEKRIEGGGCICTCRVQLPANIKSLA